ncbi:MAG: 3'-5' exonuclease [Elusimicrobia bacterium]|nr:3'-5' exonuclease [Elusimicrobiota bacterium]
MKQTSKTSKDFNSGAFKKTPFVAIDFETADYGRDSACAVGLVRVENSVITKRVHYLIKPPRKSFLFTYLHGIGWKDVCRKPTFAQLWPKIETIFEGIDFLAAHSASFDRNVLRACCAGAGIKYPPYPFTCTVRLARSVWKIYPTTLPDVCRHLQLELKHHDPLSDAEACARIVIAAHQEKNQTTPRRALW